MASLNRVMLIGNLTRDPEVKYLPSGMAVCDLAMAMNESYKSKTGELVETTCFVDVVVWAKQAETCGEYLRKGSPVFVEGSLQLDKWTSKEGEARSKLRVKATRVQFLGSPRGAEFRDGGGAGSSAGGGKAAARETPPVPAEEPDIPPDGPAGAGDGDNLPF
jgi:single-strand DNA-binding protein